MKFKSILTKLYVVEDLLAALAFILTVLFPAIEIVARTVFHSGILGSSDYIHHLVIFIAFLGAMITSRQNRHLAFSAGIEYIKSPLKEYIQTFSACLSVTVVTMLAWSSFTFAQVAFPPSARVGILPLSIVLYVIPLGFFVILVRFIANAPRPALCKVIAASGIGIAALLGFPLFHLLHLFTWPIVGLLSCAVIIGAPVFVVVGGFSLLFFGLSNGSLSVLTNEAYTLLTGPSIPAIPLLALAGFILAESKANDRLVRLSRAFFGWLPGGMGIATIIICTFFTSLTGASGVTILALGGMLSFILLENGYNKKFATGLVTVSGVGTLFPPSLPLIMYGVIAQVNIQHLFIGAMVPGLIMVLALSLFALFTAKKEKIKPIAFDAKVAFAALRESIWELLLPVIILGTFLNGLCTLVETGAIAVIYLLFVEMVIKRDIAPKALLDAIHKCITIMGGILILLAVAMGLSYFLVDAEIPQQICIWTQEHIHSKIMFLLILNIILIVAASIMDIYVAIIVVVPLIIPLGVAYGIDPIHLGVIFLANLELGYLTPPLGLNLFLSSYSLNQPLMRVSRSIVPFFIVLFIALLIITYIPQLTTGIFDLLHIVRNTGS